NIVIALGNDAREGGAHLEVALHLGEAGEIGFGGADIALCDVDGFFERLDGGLLGVILGLVGIVLLARDGTPTYEGAPTIGVGLEERFVGLALGEVGVGLLETGI